MKNAKSVICATALALALCTSAFGKSGTISATKTGTISATKTGTISATTSGTSTHGTGTISATRTGIIAVSQNRGAVNALPFELFQLLLTVFQPW